MIVWDGELFNKNELVKEGNMELETGEDEEVVLKLFDQFQEHFVEKLKGVFSFAIWNKTRQMLYLARDPLGAKPLFYTTLESNFIFASEIKSILQFPEMKALITEYGIASMFLKGIISLETKPILKDVQELGASEYLIYTPNKMRREKYHGSAIESFPYPIVKTVDKQIVLTEGEIRNIVKAKDAPSRLLEEVMIVKGCEKAGEGFTLQDFQKNMMPWKSDFETRKKLLSPHLKIDLEEFYTFQKSREKEVMDFNCVDKIASRFGYPIVLPKRDYVLEETSIRSIFSEIIQYIDSPILDLIDRDVALKMEDSLDIDTVMYLIQINMWLEEYRVQNI